MTLPILGAASCLLSMASDEARPKLEMFVFGHLQDAMPIRDNINALASRNMKSDPVPFLVKIFIDDYRGLFNVKSVPISRPSDNEHLIERIKTDIHNELARVLSRRTNKNKIFVNPCAAFHNVRCLATWFDPYDDDFLSSTKNWTDEDELYESLGIEQTYTVAIFHMSDSDNRSVDYEFISCQGKPSQEVILDLLHQSVDLYTYQSEEHDGIVQEKIEMMAIFFGLVPTPDDPLNYFLAYQRFGCFLLDPISGVSSCISRR